MLLVVIDRQQTLSLAARFARVRAQSTFLVAAILASHGALAKDDGFRPADVRFFFLLFTNWVEEDLLNPGHDLDLTQVRRALDQLVAGGSARRIAPRGGKRRATYALASRGVVALATELFAPGKARPFAEELFVACFAACYGPLLTAPGKRRHALSPAQHERIAALCDGPRIARAAMRATESRLRDLDERVRSSVALAADAARSRAEGAGESEVARRIEAGGAYQLHHVRPFAELTASLPDDVRAFELGPAMEARARLLFEPLAAAARAELAIWSDLVARG
jgi:hypothetical protein